MDQLPATTRDAYDVRIRGAGRNFRALGGDPVATLLQWHLFPISVSLLAKIIYLMWKDRGFKRSSRNALWT